MHKVNEIHPKFQLVGTISNVLVVEIGWTDVVNEGYILVILVIFYFMYYMNSTDSNLPL
jgi:hypothetical protein